MSEKAILQSKIDSLLNNSIGSNHNALVRIEEQNRLLNDSIVTLGENGPISFYANGQMKMGIEDLHYNIHPHALNQLATKFGIPTKYVNDLLQHDWGRQLLEKILTEHKNKIQRSRLLVREVDGQIRGVLSDKYRRLNSEYLYGRFINNSKQNGAVIYEASDYDTKNYISTIIPNVFEIPTENNGTVYSIFGAKMSNSDFGDGALSIKAFQMNVVCLNGIVSQSLLNQVHLGKRLPDNISFSEKTYRLDTEAMGSAIDDIMSSVLSEERIIETVTKVKEASKVLIDVDKELLKLPKMGITKDEVLHIQNKLLQNNEEDGLYGKATKWKFSQAINSTGNDLYAGVASRKHDFEELAGKLISL